ncbi:hypothetical protein [Aliikangiella sp. G2MR2-5]|uniref:hypothetical protein n=1 Tax=Aliikangiella sp. G2MR2-5 TaxID=2788943 RepID=UPI0018ABFC73|nr:hypothetical protein [Aliikangiella sp. G2MR2-5]
MQTPEQTALQKYGFKVAGVATVILLFLLGMSFKFTGDMREVYQLIEKEDCSSALNALKKIEDSYGGIVSVVKILPLEDVAQSYRKSWQLKRECEQIDKLKNEVSLPEKLNQIAKNIRNIYEEMLTLKYPEDFHGASLPEVDEDIVLANNARIKLFANAGIRTIFNAGDKLSEQLNVEKPSPEFCINLYYIQNNSFGSNGVKDVMAAFKREVKRAVPLANILCVQEILKKYNPDKSYVSIFNIKYGHVPSITHDLIKMAINASSSNQQLFHANSLLVNFLSMHEVFCSQLKEKPNADRIFLGSKSTEKVRVGKDGEWLPHIQSQLKALYSGCANSMLNRAKVAFENKKYKDAKKILDKISSDGANKDVFEQISKYQVLSDIEIAKSERAASLSPIKGQSYAAGGPAQVILINGSNSTLTIAMTGAQTVKQKISPCINCVKPEDSCKAKSNLAKFSLLPGDYNVLVKASTPGRKVKPFVGVYELKEGFFYTQCYVIRTSEQKY